MRHNNYLIKLEDFPKKKKVMVFLSSHGYYLNYICNKKIQNANNLK